MRPSLPLKVRNRAECNKWAAPSEFGTYRLCEQRRFRRACASAQSRQNLRCSLIQAVSQEEPSDRKPDPWPLWMAGHAQLKFVMTECSKTQIRLARLNKYWLKRFCIIVKKQSVSITLNSLGYSRTTVSHKQSSFSTCLLNMCSISLTINSFVTWLH